MSKIAQDITRFKAAIFDIDGVLSHQTVNMDPAGRPIRTTNVRDGYALAQCAKLGFTVGIITGGKGDQIELRFEPLGIKHLYLWANDKLPCLRDFCAKTGIAPEDIIYCGDDIPDLPVMREVGLAVCPSDAAPEVKEIAHYISPVIGGEGVARDILEQVLKAQGKWIKSSEAYGW